MAGEHTRRPKPARLGPRRNISGAFGNQGQGFIEESVRNAYQVVEPWMKQGQRMARQLSQSAYGPLNLPEGSRDMQNRWLQASGELVAAWFDMIGMATQWIAPDGGAAEFDEGCPPSITYEISSSKPIRVKLKLQPDAIDCKLKTPRFKKRNGLKVRLQPRSDSQINVRIEVGDDVQPGKYSSNVIDKHTREVVGRMRIVLD